MSHVRFAAMGTTVEAWGTTDDGRRLRAWFEEVEQACSRFRSDSELSLINDSSRVVHRPSTLLTEVLEAANWARSMTSGLVDAGLGRPVMDWGYDRPFTEVGSIAEPPAATSSPDWTIEQGVLRTSAHTRIDLGGIAKGWTCDRAIELGLASVVSAGGDLRSSDPSTVVHIIDHEDEPAVRLRLGSGAVATSSTTRRRWQVGSREVSHLIDPRTLSPVHSPVLSASVVAASAAEAEAGAKAVLLLGETGLAWADEQPWVHAAIVVWHDGSVFAAGPVREAA